MLVSPVMRVVRGPVPRIFARSMFMAKKHDISKPKWLNVTFAFGTSFALLALLIKQRSDDVAEYKRRHGLK